MDHAQIQAIFSDDTQTISVEHINTSIQSIMDIHKSSTEYQQAHSEYVSLLKNVLSATPSEALKQLYAHPVIGRVQMWDEHDQSVGARGIQSEQQFAQNARAVHATFNAFLSITSHAEPLDHQSVRILQCVHTFISASKGDWKTMVDGDDLKLWAVKTLGVESPSDHAINRYRHYYYSCYFAVEYNLQHLLFGMCAWGKSNSQRTLRILRHSRTANVIVALICSADNEDGSSLNQSFIDKYLKC